MTTAHKILGWTDETTVCDCCGKAKLSGTFAVEFDGDILHFGSTCVTRNTGVKNPTSAAATYRREREHAARARLIQTPEYRAYESALARRPRDLVGVAAAEMVRVEHRALRAVETALKAEFNISYLGA